jgi:predicted GNAT family N-acyltransferase
VGDAAEGVAEIGRVVVLPEYRGKHLGQAVVAEGDGHTECTYSHT